MIRRRDLRSGGGVFLIKTCIPRLLVNSGNLQAVDPVARRPACPPKRGEGERREKKMTAGRWGFDHCAQRRVVCKELIRSLGAVCWGDKRTQPETKVGGGGKSEGVSCLHYTIWGFCFLAVGGVYERKAEGHAGAAEHVGHLCPVCSGSTNWEKYDSLGD